MRPKKRVLLYCHDRDRLGEVAFVLKTLGTKYLIEIYSCDSMKMLRHLLDRTGEFRWFAAVLWQGDEKPSSLAAKISRIQASGSEMIRTLLVVREQRLLQTQADMTCLEGEGIAEMLEHLRVLCARKRGPRGRRVPIKLSSQDVSASELRRRDVAKTTERITRHEQHLKVAR